MDSEHVDRWVAGYVEAWRAPGTYRLGELFTEDVTYLPSPWAQPVRGLAELTQFWEAERDEGEEFTLTSDIVVADGDIAIVRLSVEYVEPVAGSWRDLWVLRFAADGRCSSFEEWPFAPGQRDGHERSEA
jgi:ketosteroid isomerase-like protein